MFSQIKHKFNDNIVYTNFNYKEVERKLYVIILNINLVVLLNFLFNTHTHTNTHPFVVSIIL